MIIIPAIDLMDGKVVRLKQGKKEDYTFYSDDPVGVAERFESLGARRIHVVDLDRAFGRGDNTQIIMKMAETLKHALIEVGGGVRSLEDVQKLLCCRVQRVIIGSMPFKNPRLFERIVDQYAEHIIVAVDVEDSKVRVSGWREDSKADHIAFISGLQQMGIREVIVTDITRDGTLQGVDIDFYKNIALKTSIGIIASGGVKGMEDLEQLSRLEPMGVIGVVVGKAIYENRLNLEEALKRFP